MAYPVVEYVNVVAGTTDFDVPFPFISTAHVEVLVNAKSVYVSEWIGDRRLRLMTPVQTTDVVVIRRQTPIDQALVMFQDGAVLTQEDLNTAVQQLLYAQQELGALYEGTLKTARVRLGEANGIVTDPEAVMAELANLVLEDEVLAMFRQRIADIDLTAQQVLEVVVGSQEVKETLTDLAKDLTEVQRIVDAVGDLENNQGLAARFEQVQQAIIKGDEVIAALVALLGAKSGSSNAFILDLDNVKVSPTESLAQRLTTIKAATDGNGAAIQAAQKATADAISAEASARTTLAATLRGEVAATIQTEAKTRADQDGVFANTFTLLGAQAPDGRAFILNDATVKLANGQALATRLSGLDTSLGNVSSSIQNLDRAIAGVNTALSESIGVVRTDVGNLTSTVSTLSQSINGVRARYGVSLDVNGYVTGFLQNNDGREGSFVVVANRFAIVDPNNGAPFVPFEVSNGTTYIKNAVIGNLSLVPEKLAYGASGETSIYQNFYSQTFNSSVFQGMASLAITPKQGQPIEGMFNCLLTNVSGTSTQVLLRIIRDDGTPVWGGTNGLIMAARDEGESLSVNFIDSVPAGRVTTYTVQMRKPNGATQSVRVDGRFMRLREDTRTNVQSVVLSAPAGEGAGRGAGGGGSINGGGSGFGSFYQQ